MAKIILCLRATPSGIIDEAKNIDADSTVILVNNGGILSDYCIDISKKYYVVSSNTINDVANGDYTITGWANITEDCNQATSIFGIYSEDTSSVVCPMIRMGSSNAKTGAYFNYYTDSSANYSYSSYLLNTGWHYYTITREGNTCRFFIDGSLKKTYTMTKDIIDGAMFGVNTDYTYAPTTGIFTGYVDDVCIIKGEALWTSDFTPPTDYLKLYYYAYLSNNNLYTGISLTNLTNNWSGLTSTEKEALVSSFSDEMPSIQDLSSISPFRVLTYGTSSENVKVTGQPKPQIIEPTSLINTGAVSTIQSINITNILTDATVKFAITTDLTTYKVYDATQGEWVTSTNIEEDGMSIAQINALTPQILALLDISNGIAFKQCFIATSENASAELSEISAVVDIDGSWTQSVHGTDYNVAYPNKTTMSVRLLTNGDYIINYPISSST